MTLRIGALEKLSTIDYPDKVSCVIFFKGCNFSCGFCYNKQLVMPEYYNENKDVSESEIHYFLDKRKGLIDAVVLSGGEPTIYGDELIKFIKDTKARGYLVKLDTNGSNPETLNKIISEKLVDYIAMDLKDDFENYSKYTSVPIDAIKKSFELVKSCKIPHEFRITTHPELTQKSFNNLLDIAKGENIFVQDFVNKNTIQSYINFKTIYLKLSKSDTRYKLR